MTSPSQALQPIPALEQALARNVKQLESICGGSDQARRCARLAVFDVSRNEMLMQCTPDSIVKAVMQSAACGLEIGTARAEAYLIPYKNKGRLEARFQPGYQGLIVQALRVPEIKKITARAVYEGDYFEYIFGLDEDVKHRPAGETDPKKLTHVYAVAFLADGERSFVVLTRDQIERRRKMSQMPDGPAWTKNYEAMALKTAVISLAKWLPRSSKFDAVLEAERRSEGLEVGFAPELDDVPIIEGEAEVVVPEDTTKTDGAGLAASLEQKQTKREASKPAKPAKKKKSKSGGKKSKSAPEPEPTGHENVAHFPVSEADEMDEPFPGDFQDPADFAEAMARYARSPALGGDVELIFEWAQKRLGDIANLPGEICFQLKDDLEELTGRKL